MQQNITDDLRNNVLALNTHLGSSLSCLEIITTLYTQNILRYSVDEPIWSERDRFILSKGHAGPALYVVLAAVGFFRRIGGDFEVLQTMGNDGAVVGRHPDNIAIPGIDCTSGALGEGLGVAAGMALGLKRRGSNARVFVLLGDGECDLGPVWEAADLIARNQLNRVVVTVDVNGLSYCNSVNNEALRAKWEGFGWEVSEADGHNVASLAAAYKAISNGQKPHVILAHTQKGYGSPAAGTIASHSYALNSESRPSLKRVDLSPYRPTISEEITAQHIPHAVAPQLELTEGTGATRDVGYSLDQWVAQNPSIVPICPDVEESTRLSAKTDFIHMGIKEASSISVAAGLASVGCIPIVSMFDDFLLGALREVKNTVVIPKLPVIIMTTHSGVGLGKDGATHHSMTAPVVLGTFEEITYFEPADLREANQLLAYALQHPTKPYYIRLARQPADNVCPFHALEKLQWVEQGAYRVMADSAYDATLIATGALVNTAQTVAAKLTKRGVKLNVVNCFSPSLFRGLSHAERAVFADPEKPIFTAIDAHPSVLSEFANAWGGSYGVTHTTVGGGDAPYFYKVNQLNASTLAFNIENKLKTMQGEAQLSVQDTVLRQCRNILQHKERCILFVDGPTRAGTSTFSQKLKMCFESEGLHVSGILDSDYFLLSREARSVLKQFAPNAWLYNMNWFSWKHLADLLGRYAQGEKTISLDDVYTHDSVKKQSLNAITVEPRKPNVLIVEGPFIVNGQVKHFADYVVHLETSPAERWRRMMAADSLSSRKRTPEEQAALNADVYEPSRLLYESVARQWFNMEINNDDPEAKKILYFSDVDDAAPAVSEIMKDTANKSGRRKEKKYAKV